MSKLDDAIAEVKAVREMDEKEYAVEKKKENALIAVRAIKMRYTQWWRYRGKELDEDIYNMLIEHGWKPPDSL